MPCTCVLRRGWTARQTLQYHICCRLKCTNMMDSVANVRKIEFVESISSLVLVSYLTSRISLSLTSLGCWDQCQVVFVFLQSLWKVCSRIFFFFGLFLCLFKIQCFNLNTMSFNYMQQSLFYSIPKLTHNKQKRSR